jgi:nicotinamidase-related amidase
MKALIIIDVQNYFINDTVKDLPGRIAEYLKNNKGKYDFIFFAQGINTPDSHFVKQLGWKGNMTAEQQAIHPALREFLTNTNTFTKTTYSIFKNEAFVNKIKEENITDITFCGVDADACVLASMFDAFDLGYTIHLLEDLTKSHYGEEFDKAAMMIMRKNLEKK